MTERPEISIQSAYAVCQAIARREAKNFYYAFRVLPRHKRDAICAVYAFMRHADDLADDETHSPEQRLLNTQQWLAQWHRAAQGDPTGDPVFIALRDAQARFGISIELLDKLVQGTMMDLTSSVATELTSSGEFAVYRTFNELYNYCYYVASVVGLVCIRIFGYTDPRAEELAEQIGVAFQLTNILRDVREDAERNRIYLPLEDLAQHRVTIEQLATNRGGRSLTPQEYALMNMEGQRARRYYTAAEKLLPLISPDGQPALWVLVTIYRRLLERIEAARYEVFSAKIRVPTLEKVAILLRGFWMAWTLRSSTSRNMSFE